MAEAIRIEGLKELRRDLKRMHPELVKELRVALKSAAEIVAPVASRKAPRLSGRLAGTVRAGTQGNKAYVGSRLPYAGVQEFGGTIAPRGTPIHIRPRHFISDALDQKADDVMDKVGDGIERLAERTGWRRG